MEPISSESNPFSEANAIAALNKLVLEKERENFVLEQKNLSLEHELQTAESNRDLGNAISPQQHSNQLDHSRPAIGENIILWTGEEVAIERAKEILGRLDCPPGVIYARYGDWAVTSTGIDCLSRPYFITWDRLNEHDWERHLSQKTWVNTADIAIAIRNAKKLKKLLKK